MDKGRGRREYAAPRLERLGDIRSLTRNLKEGVTADTGFARLLGPGYGGNGAS
jgi:hypothetical protein